MQTIHIIPSNHHQNLKELLLENATHLTNTLVLDFDIAFGLQQNRYELLLNVHQKIKLLDLPILKETVQFTKISETIISMIKEMNLYNLNPNDLPSQTALDLEILQCISSVYDMVSKPQLDSDTHYIAYSGTLTHAQETFLVHHDIEIQTLPQATLSRLHFKHALNQRQELEGALQDIIQQSLEHATFVIPNLDTHIPLIETTFKRYGISLSLENRGFEVAKSQFVSFMSFALNNTTSNLIAILRTNSLKLNSFIDLIYLIETYGFPLITSSSLEPVQKIIDRSLEDATQLNAIIEQFNDLSFEESIQVSYNLLTQYQYHSLKPLKSFIETNHMFFSLESKDVFLEAIANLSSPHYEHPSFTFYDLNDFAIIPAENVYALMLSEKNYPAIGSHSGIFDESYRNRINSYPSLQLRTQHQLRHKARFLHNSKNLTLSYAISDYEGKPHAPSFAIENFVKDHGGTLTTWNLIENQQRMRQPKSLTPTTAKELFSDENGIIHTSVSALQLYTQDPYQYFIERGLKLQKPEYPVFDARTLGTINHFIMESFHKKTLTSETIEHLFTPYPAPFEQMIYHRDRELMERNLKIIQEGQEVSVLETQNHVETRFSKYPLFNYFSLTGIIDRIDISDQHLMIVDYKSSSQSLSIPKVKSGEQLQLLSYGVIASEIMKKELFAVYNYGFNDSNIATSKQKYSSSKGIIPIESSIKDLYLSQKKYTGWVFTPLNDLLSSAQYHSGVRELKDGLSVSPAPYNFKTVRFVLEQVYHSIYTNIMSGVIDINKLEIVDLDEINLKEDL